jgi:hypothetical protein
MSYALIAGLFCFGIINEKRAIVFLLPFILIASLVANRGEGRGQARRVGLSSYLVIFVVIAAGVTLGIRSIPSLNPEGSYVGGVSLSHAAQYALEYVTMDYGGSLQGSYELAARDDNVQVGRAIIWLHIIQWLNDSGPWTWMFGNGFGSATRNAWTNSGSDPLFDVIASRGGISGAGLAAVETGMVGLALATYAFLHIGMTIRRCRREAKSHIAIRWYRTTALLLAIFAFDFFFYSTVLLRTMPLPLIFFAIVASIVLVRNWELRQSRRSSPVHAAPVTAVPVAGLS